MDIFLIWGMTPDTISTLSLCDGWDRDCIDGNPSGYQDAIQSARGDYGTDFVTITRASIDLDAVRATFDKPAAETAILTVNLIWRIEDGWLELVSAWDGDTISENFEGWKADIEKGNGEYRVTSHNIDLDAVRATFDPPLVPLS